MGVLESDINFTAVCFMFSMWEEWGGGAENVPSTDCSIDIVMSTNES